MRKYSTLADLIPHVSFPSLAMRYVFLEKMMYCLFHGLCNLSKLFEKEGKVPVQGDPSLANILLTLTHSEIIFLLSDFDRSFFLKAGSPGAPFSKEAITPCYDSTGTPSQAV